MKTLILKNTLMKSISTVESYIKEKCIPHTLVTFLNDEEIPCTDEYDSVVILGGYMSSNDTDENPFLVNEIELIQDFTNKNKKIFGICLGAQLMAKAYGEKVYKGPQKEVGWVDIHFNSDFKEENITNRLATSPYDSSYEEKIKGFQWHNDTFYLPGKANLLATGDLYKNQAFKLANKSYATQFHIEVNEDMINEWLDIDRTFSEQVLQDNKNYLAKNVSRATNFYDYFFFEL